MGQERTNDLQKTTPCGEPSPEGVKDADLETDL